MCYITIIYGNNGGIKLHSQASLSPSQPLDFYLAYNTSLNLEEKLANSVTAKENILYPKTSFRKAQKTFMTTCIISCLCTFIMFPGLRPD